MIQNFSYETQGNESYLIYTFPNESTTNSLIVGMMSNNRINGLLPLSYHQMGTARYARYNISSLVSLKKLCEGTIKRKTLLNIFRSIANTYINSEDYAIDPQSIVVDTQYIYVNPANGETFMVCVPCDAVKSSLDIRSLYRDIMLTVIFDRTENCSYIGQIELYLSSDSFNLSDFKRFIDEIDIEEPVSIENFKPVIEEEIVSEKEQKIFSNVSENKVQGEIYTSRALQSDVNTYSTPQYQSQAPVYQQQNQSYGYEQQYQNNNAYVSQYQNGNDYGSYQQTYQTDSNNLYQQQYQNNNDYSNYNNYSDYQQYQTDNNNSYYQQQYQQPEQPNNDPYAETSVLGVSNYNETTVLGGDSYENTSAAYLIRHKNGERVLISKETFHIGKEKSTADYFISDNSAISRRHAEVIKRNGEYYIIDTNSTNHVYINGIRIPCNVETHIVSGTEIILADERFDFVIM